MDTNDTLAEQITKLSDILLEVKTELKAQSAKIQENTTLSNMHSVGVATLLNDLRSKLDIYIHNIPNEPAQKEKKTAKPKAKSTPTTDATTVTDTASHSSSIVSVSEPVEQPDVDDNSNVSLSDIKETKKKYNIREAFVYSYKNEPDKWADILTADVKAEIEAESANAEYIDKAKNLEDREKRCIAIYYKYIQANHKSYLEQVKQDLNDGNNTIVVVKKLQFSTSS